MDRISMITALFARALAIKSIGGDSLSYIGVTTTALSDGATTNPITIDGDTVTATNGNVALYGGDAFVFNGTIWQASSAISQIFTEIGDLSDLDTEAKTDLVSAINEVNEEKQDDVELSLTPTAVVSDRDIQDGQGNTLSVLAEALTKIASGNPVVITDCAGGKARSLITSIEPIQDLHGLPFPYVGGAYKNKLPLSLAYIKTKNTTGTWADNVYTLNGIAYTVITRDGDNVIEIKANGTASANAYLLLFDEGTSGVPDNIKGQDIILSGCPVRSGNPYTVMLNSWGTAAAIYDNGTDHGTATFPANPAGMRCDIEVYSGAELSNVSFYPMVALQSASNPTTFAPYSNICPISGRDRVAVERTGQNLWDEDYAGIAQSIKYTPVYVGDGSFTLRTTAPRWDNSGCAVFLLAGSVSSGATNADHGAYNGSPRTQTAVNGYVTVAYRIVGDIDPRNYDTELIKTSEITNATIQLGQTVYGGSVDFTTGTATVTHAIADMGDLSYEYLSDNNAFRSTSALPGATSENVFVNSISSAYHENQTGMANMANGDFRVQGGIVYLKDFRYTLASDLKTAVTGQTICYELATPIELTLTPTEVQMLKGYNRVTIESGSIEIEYIAKAISGNDEEIAPLVGDKATKSYAVNDFIERADGLYRVTAPIASGASFTANNTVKMSIGEALTYLYNK